MKKENGWSAPEKCFWCDGLVMFNHQGEASRSAHTVPICTSYLALVSGRTNTDGGHLVHENGINRRVDAAKGEPS